MNGARKLVAVAGVAAAMVAAVLQPPSVAVAAPAGHDHDGHVHSSAIPRQVARAVLLAADGTSRGSVTFAQGEGGVRIRVEASGLTPGFHGIHIHAVGNCTVSAGLASDPFGSAGGHWVRQASNHGDHDGDLVPLLVNADGTARQTFNTNTFILDDVFDADGSAVIVHAGADNLANIPSRYQSTAQAEPGADATTRATGDSGGRVACGVVEEVLQPLRDGYWLAAADGGVFAYGSAPFRGSTGGLKLAAPVVGMAPAPHGDGYYMVAEDGGVFAFNAQFAGSHGGQPLAAPIVDIATPPSDSIARLIAPDGSPRGEVLLTQEPGRVRIKVRAVGLSYGFHGFHVHAVGNCAGFTGLANDPFGAAGGHHNPGAAGHGSHAGDLPALFANADGTVHASFTTTAFRLDDLSDGDNTSFVVHEGRDNYGNIPARYQSTAQAEPGPDATTLATGDAGSRALCGALQRVHGGPIASYWLAAEDGGIFPKGDAPYLGSPSQVKPAARIVGMASSVTGLGYLVVGEDGGVYAYGDASFHGSTGNIKLAQPVFAIAPTPTGRGYWLVALDGGIFAFGDAVFRGSLGATKLNAPIVSMIPTPTGQGYWLIGADGGVFAFGDASFFGSAGGLKLDSPVLDAATLPR